jgi:hypothetical protein
MKNDEYRIFGSHFLLIGKGWIKKRKIRIIIIQF